MTSMGGDLILNMTCCRGINAVKAIPLSTEEDPFFGVLGAAENILVDDAISVNRVLYSQVAAGATIPEAVRAVNKDMGRDLLFCSSAEGYRYLRTQAPDVGR
jgi:hypothetical protein